MDARLTARAFLPVLVASLGIAGTTREAAAQSDRIFIPANTVVHAELDQSLSSRNARVGQRVAARIDPADRSGFPEGTRFEGTITQVQRSNNNRPGIIDMEFQRAWLPDGQRVSIDGTLASLGDDDVQRTSDGRIVARRQSGDSFDWKWVGYGAGAGAILGGILGDDDWLKGALLGGLGGAIYSYLNRDRDRNFRDVSLDRGADFGIRLDNRVAFNDRNNYRYVARNTLNGRFENDQVLGEREELRSDTEVRLDGRIVRFGDAQPLRMNGQLYVPLRPIADAAEWRYVHRRGDLNFTLNTPDGPVRGYAGEDSVVVRGDRTQRLTSTPISINGEIYVPTEYLSRTAGMRVDWDRTGNRLTLDTYR